VVSDVGEKPALAMVMADIFAREINFIRDLHPGDSFTLIMEKHFRDGEFKGYGRISGAHFINQGTTYEAYLFNDADGFPYYYTQKGESVKRAFLKAPLSFTRISSTFSPRRLHPILKVWRAHPGVDYAAPTGTPVKAIGNGTVTFKGWSKGVGNYIALKHNNGYESMYLHLSAFARGLNKGKKVQQGEVIGFVGSTGYFTGSHLDFRMKKDG
jgi:murein DD-endopeptidase MepM/ murein hydrolase activator NlpD